MKDYKLTEQELVYNLRSKNSKNFEILYGYFSLSLYGTICQIIADKEQAQNILTDTFLNAWNNSASYKEEESRLFTWLLNIAKKEANDFVDIQAKINEEELYNQTHLLFK